MVYIANTLATKTPPNKLKSKASLFKVNCPTNNGIPKRMITDMKQIKINFSNVVNFILTPQF